VSIERFPARSFQSSATVGSNVIDVVTVGFSDKITVNVNVNGKISSMVGITENWVVLELFWRY
jgi:hypothetical protein